MIKDIWASFRGLPVWVQIWIGIVLVPVNLAPLAFLDQPNGGLIAALSITGMALNIPIMLAARGMSKAMALPHLLVWSPLVVIVALTLADAEVATSGYLTFLTVLLVVDLISLGFDVNDARLWMKGRETK